MPPKSSATSAPSFARRENRLAPPPMLVAADPDAIAEAGAAERRKEQRTA